MKNFTVLTLCSLFTLGGILTTTPALSCVDYHEQAPFTAVINESQTDIELTVTNLTIFAGAPGAVCSCGLTTFDDIFDNIYYMAFVDTLTGEPIPGFAVWTNNAEASVAWENYSGLSTSWNGFIADVVNDMIPNFPVNLIIRFSIPQPPELEEIYEQLSAASLGTDEWDPEAGNLADSHNSISPLTLQSIEVVDDSYFESTGISESNAAIMNVFPNPTDGFFYVESDELKSNAVSIEVYNAAGQFVKAISTQSGSQVAVDLVGKSSGLYFVRMSIANEVVSISKVVVD